MRFTSDDFDEEYFQKGTKSHYVDYWRGDDFSKEALEEVKDGFKTLVKGCLDLIDMPESVLIIGGAIGYEALVMHDLGIKYILNTDISKFALSHTLWKHSLLCDVIEGIPLPDNTFDVVYAADILEHIHEENVDKALSELSRVTKRYMCAIIPLSHSPHKIPTQDDDATHVTLRNRDWWLNKMELYFDAVPSITPFIIDESRPVFIMEKIK